MTDAELIEGLGGMTAVARRLGVEPNRVNNWKRRGIPGEHYLPLWALALAAGLDWEPPGAAELRPLLVRHLCPGADTIMGENGEPLLDMLEARLAALHADSPPLVEQPPVDEFAARLERFHDRSAPVPAQPPVEDFAQRLAAFHAGGK